MAEEKKAILSLGANLGDRKNTLSCAVADIVRLRGTRVIKVSPVYETKAWGVSDQPDYLNLCILIETKKTPSELLSSIHRLEYRYGRKREYRFAPRTLDIDIIGFEGIVSEEKRLTLPHPRASQRAFVIVPLLDILPDKREIEEKFGLKFSESFDIKGVNPVDSE